MQVKSDGQWKHPKGLLVQKNSYVDYLSCEKRLI